jgi:hypothetical protein
MRAFVFLVAILVTSAVQAQSTLPVLSLEACMQTVLACIASCKDNSACLASCKAANDRCLNAIPKPEKAQPSPSR